MINDADIKTRIVDFAAKTDVFIARSLNDIARAELNAGRKLMENEIGTITNR